MNKSILTFSVLTLLSVSCGQKNKSFYESARFRVYPDRVEQGNYTARALSNTHLVSDYQSLA
ncbi:MAG: hypothetical protein Q8N05_17105, partial [Bacteroidota bacterium]|nr:hypothetical protein [Bacteroidota bacterium]